jgi:hypothetical protein
MLVLGGARPPEHLSITPLDISLVPVPSACCKGPVQTPREQIKATARLPRELLEETPR